MLATARVPVKALAPCVVQLGTGLTLFPGAIYKEPRQIQLLQLLLMWHCENAGKSNNGQGKHSPYSYSQCGIVKMLATAREPVKAFTPWVVQQGTGLILFPRATYKEPRQVQPLQLLLMWHCENFGSCNNASKGLGSLCGPTRKWINFFVPHTRSQGKYSPYSYCSCAIVKMLVTETLPINALAPCVAQGTV